MNINNTENNRVIIILLGAVLTIVACIAFLYKLNRNENQYQPHINVEGYAECEVIADMAEWSICFEYVGAKHADLSRKIESEKPKVMQFLMQHGIRAEDVEFYNYVKEDYSNSRDRDDSMRYRIGCCAKVRTDAVDIVTNLKNNLCGLFEENIAIVKNSLELRYSKQKEMEQSIYKKAIKNAVDKASDITKFMGLKLKKVLKVDQARFVTSSPYPEMDAVYSGINIMRSAPDDSASRTMKNKKIKAYVNLEIGIK